MNYHVTGGNRQGLPLDAVASAFVLNHVTITASGASGMGTASLSGVLERSMAKIESDVGIANLQASFRVDVYELNAQQRAVDQKVAAVFTNVPALDVGGFTRPTFDTPPITQAMFASVPFTFTFGEPFAIQVNLYADIGARLAHVVLVNPLDVEAHLDFANSAFFTLAQVFA